MVGKVDYDETRLADITAWVGGRLDRLYVDYTGVPVRKGDHLVSMYSPDLIVAQRELILAMK
jgi:Cu(I)/Ag(I) efflux system membrane fusion protein